MRKARSLGLVCPISLPLIFPVYLAFSLSLCGVRLSSIFRAVRLADKYYISFELPENCCRISGQDIVIIRYPRILFLCCAA
jgi:hypothetical protein